MICLEFENQTTSASAAPSVHNTHGFIKVFKTILNLLVENEVLQWDQNLQPEATKHFTYNKRLLQKSGAADEDVAKKVRSLTTTLVNT